MTLDDNNHHKLVRKARFPLRPGPGPAGRRRPDPVKEGLPVVLDPQEPGIFRQGQIPAHGTVPWTERPLAELIDFIVKRYHVELGRELPELVAMAAKVEQSHAEKPTRPRGLAAHLEKVHAAVLDHLAKEEQVLFPMILAGHGTRAAGPVQAMEYEHRDHASNLQRTREFAHDLTPPAEACGTWQALYLRLGALEAELMEHIHLENNVLFPRALRES